MTLTSIRRIALAALAGATVALVCEAMLRLALDAVIDSGGMTPWWATARVFERGVWIVAAAMLWSCAPLVAAACESGRDSDEIARATAFRAVGISMIAMPPLLIVSSWVVSAIRITLAGEWSIDGRAFLESSYYANLLIGNAPWMLAGAVLIVSSRHLRT